MKDYQKRSEVPLEYRCDLTRLYKSDDDWSKEYQDVKKELSSFNDYKNCVKDAFLLEEYLRKSADIEHKISDLELYAVVAHDLDLKNSKYITMLSQANSLISSYIALNSFFMPSLVSLSLEEFQALFQRNSKLEDFKVLLEKSYRLKGHVLSESEERLISELSETFDDYDTISNSLINSEHDYGKITLENGKRVTIAANNVRYLKRNKSQKIRKKVHEQFARKLVQYEDTAAFLLNGCFKNYANLARISHYNSVWELKLEDYMLPDKVFQNLIRVAKENANFYQDYFCLNKNVLNLKTLNDYDLVAEWNSLDKEYSIEEAKAIILEALKPLGSKYQKFLLKMYEDKIVDFCQYKGKTNGGYCSGTASAQTCIVMSFNGSYDNITTLAHELGHAINYKYISESNPKWYFANKSIVGEVASLTNEFLLNHYISQNALTKEEKLLGIENSLRTFGNNFYSAVYEGEMEQLMYKHIESGNTITAEFMNDLIGKQHEIYEGNKVKYKTNHQWITRSHYYMFFYLFDYAVCVSVAAQLARRIINGEPNIIERYENFLSCGSDISPIDMYAKLGVDITDSKVFEEAVSFYKEQLDLYYEIYKEGEVDE